MRRQCASQRRRLDDAKREWQARQFASHPFPVVGLHGQPHASCERPEFAELDEHGTAFAAVALEPDGTLAVWWCPACDNGHRIAFNRETRGFFVAGPATHR